jgi:hypothetical protein
MDNPSFKDELPIKASIYIGFSWGSIADDA